MSIWYIMYLTPTWQEAYRVVLMAKRIHAEPVAGCAVLAPITNPPDKKVFREPQYGNPRVEVHWQIATQNSALAGDKAAWHKAVELYESFPYPIAWALSWVEYWKRRQKCR